MSLPFTLSLAADTQVESPAGGDQLTIRSPRGGVLLAGVTPGVRAAIQALREGGSTAAQLTEIVEAIDSGRQSSGSDLRRLLARLAEETLLCYTAGSAGDRLATATPISPEFQLRDPALEPDRQYVLSRFACCRREGAALVLESPLSHAIVILHDWRGAAMLAAAAAPMTVLHPGTLPGVSREEAVTFLGLLRGAGMLTDLSTNGMTREEECAGLAQWEFHDLLFHTRSRLGRHRSPYGSEYPFIGRIESLPAVRPAWRGQRIPLSRPDLGRLMEQDPPFSRVLEERRSVRDHGVEPITDRELGEFLYRVARVKSRGTGERDQTTSRSYPGAGARYSLELYVVVGECRGLPPGLFHYHPVRHELTRLCGSSPDLAQVLDDARGFGGQADPQVLIILAARFQRMTWKYRSMAYAAILKDVGVLYQTMYLVATAMGLAPCALGGGNADAFARATGTDYYAESSVGEFLLGSSPFRSAGGRPTRDDTG